MTLSLYANLGVCLLLGARNPSANRSVIAFAAWSSCAHASVMAVMAIQVPTARAECLITAGVLSIIGALLIVLLRESRRQHAMPQPAKRMTNGLRRVIWIYSKCRLANS